MGAVEDAVDAAANFIGPFINKSRKEDSQVDDQSEPLELVHQALSHLQCINTADLAADPDAPYDASLAGVVYGLLDLVTTLGILPHLSPGLVFSQRPRSVLTVQNLLLPSTDRSRLSKVVETLLPILEQRGSGVEPLLSQRIFPDIISALAELSFSPASHKTHNTFRHVYKKLIAEASTSRLLPLLTTFLQQPLPTWLRPVMSKELAMVPLRQQGVRHTIEFLSLSYLSKNFHVPQDASGPQSQIPIPLEAITQASRLLVLPPACMKQDGWFGQLAPQLWDMLDGNEGRELSRAAGQIIAGGILSKKVTGAPGTIGWELFAQPLLRSIYPRDVKELLPLKVTTEMSLVQEYDLERALKRLSTIMLSYSHAGLFKRLVGPLLLPLWALLNYAQARPALNEKWALLPNTILSRYIAVACDPRQIDTISSSLFWDGNTTWTFGPGSEGGIEIRWRSADSPHRLDMESVVMHYESLDSRIKLLVSLLANAKIPDDAAGSIFLQATKRWLAPPLDNKPFLTDEIEIDPLYALTNARISEAMARTFQDQLARSPQHIMELMRQLLSNFVNVHQGKVQKFAKRNSSTRANLHNIVQAIEGVSMDGNAESDTVNEEIVSFAISILKTLFLSPNFKQTPETKMALASVIPPLVYLLQDHSPLPVSNLITNSANTLLQLLQSAATPTQTHPTDLLAEHREIMTTVLSDLTSLEPPNRTWALNALRKLVQNPAAFPVIDVPSLTHLLLFASLADPESYVHTAAVPVLVDLAIRAPHLTVRTLVDAFIDTDEQSLRLGQGRQTEEKEMVLQQALDFRLRIGEVLSNFVLDDSFWHLQSDATTRYRCLKQITGACLSLASRRSQRKETFSTRTQLRKAKQQLQDESEAAWGGPIPNLLDPDGDDSKDRTERDALINVVQGWEDTGIEEDVRIRASALSVLSTVLEHRLVLLRQAVVDAALQMALLVLTMEASEAKGMLRRAAVLVVMGLLRGLDGALEAGEETIARLGTKHGEEMERVLRWIRDEDVDALVRDHAASVLESVETLYMKKLYKVKDSGLKVGADLGLEGSLRGLDVQANLGESRNERRKLIAEEVE